MSTIWVVALCLAPCLASLYVGIGACYASFLSTKEFGHNSSPLGARVFWFLLWLAIWPIMMYLAKHNEAEVFFRD